MIAVILSQEDEASVTIGRALLSLAAWEHRGLFYGEEVFGTGQVLLVPIKDIIIGFIWFVPFFSRTVMWRRHKYKITKGSLLVPVPPHANKKAP